MHPPHNTLRILAVVLLAAVGRRSAGAQRAAACGPGTWTEPSPVQLPDGRPVYVEEPVPVGVDHGLAMFGSPTFVWRSATIFADSSPASAEPADHPILAGVVVQPAGSVRVLRMPSGVQRPLALRALPRGDGELDVFWGETPDTSWRAEGRVAELWHARYGARAWSVPERLAASDRIWWNATFPALLATTNAAVLAVPVQRAGTRKDSTGILVLRRSAGTWERAWIPAGQSPATFLALAPTASRGLVLAYIGSPSAPDDGAGEVAVLVSRSGDGGATWTRPRSIVHSAEAGLNWLRVVATADGTLHAVWTAEWRDVAGSTRRTLGRAASRDGGVSWTVGAPVDNDANVEALDAVATGRRVLLVGRRQVDRQLVAGIFADSGALTLHPLPFDAAATLPRLAPVGSDSVLLNWGIRRAGAYPAFPSLPAPALFTAIYISRCDTVP